MKISLEWLKDYVDIPLEPSDLANRLTHAGLEVEDLVRCQPRFRRVRVAELLSFHPHPQSKRLHICQVFDGWRNYSVVCGAPNLKEGQRVALAPEGATLADGTTIQAIAIQGILSEGMLCSEKELGVGEDASGIMALDPHLCLGAPLEDALSLQDWILELNVTPNRSDCLCVLGIAREVAALMNVALRYPQNPKAPDTGKPTIKTSVVIERPDLCPRYVAELILGVRIGPSPFWMRRRLQAVGARPINNIVDVTNYVMLELGQPLHAFDFERLEEGRIVVRAARAGESFVTLDGNTRTIPEGALFICDGKKPVALAGIMGGWNSEVQSTTTNILLESAYFNPMGIRRTSKKIGLSTEASLRFERGVDPNGCRRAADRAGSLMVELAGGTLSPEVVDNYPRRHEAKKIILRPPRVNQILGSALGPADMQDYLRKLQLQVESTDSNSLLVTVPTFRVDLEREIDLVEEIARIHGFHRIPETLPVGDISPGQRASKPRAIQRARDLLTAFGFREVINYSFIGRQALDALRLAPEDARRKVIRIQNPLSEDQSCMRTTLIPGLLQAARTNFFRQNFNLRFFEMGRVFFPQPDRELPEEIDYLSGFLTGMRHEESWATPKEEIDFFDLKGVLQAFFAGLRVLPYRFIPEKEEPFLHPGKACRILNNQGVLGIMGELHPDVALAYELKPRIFLFELNFDAVVKTMDEKRSFRPFPRFPAVYRDLALIVEETIPAGDLLRAIEEMNDGTITEIRIFDLYRGNQIPSGKKSLAFRLKYQKEDRTLTDEEVSECHQKVIQSLVERYGAALR